MIYKYIKKLRDGVGSGGHILRSPKSFCFWGFRVFIYYIEGEAPSLINPPHFQSPSPPSKHLFFASPPKIFQDFI